MSPTHRVHPDNLQERTVNLHEPQITFHSKYIKISTKFQSWHRDGFYFLQIASEVTEYKSVRPQ